MWMIYLKRWAKVKVLRMIVPGGKLMMLIGSQMKMGQFNKKVCLKQKHRCILVNLGNLTFQASFSLYQIFGCQTLSWRSKGFYLYKNSCVMPLLLRTVILTPITSSHRIYSLLTNVLKSWTSTESVLACWSISQHRDFKTIS